MIFAGAGLSHGPAQQGMALNLPVMAAYFLNYNVPDYEMLEIFHI